MDVHRSRFVPYPVSPITATAFSRSNDDGSRAGYQQPPLKLAIGRQDGQIEIWDPLGGQWIQEAVFPGDGSSIDGLVWTRDPDELDHEGQLVYGQYRLFSIASSPAVIEWDLSRGRPKKTSTGNFSEVWCFATQPRLEQKEGDEEEVQSQDIVAGCGDGTIVLLSTADNDLTFKRYLARVPGKKAKCMSIAYQNRERVLAGFMDSTIRIFDARNGFNVRTMSLGVGLPGAPKNAIVWQIRSLANGDIVSGDSNGEVVFWDGRSYTLSQRIKAHDSECLDLVVNADGKTVLSGSNDGRVAVFRQTTSAGGLRSWAKSHHRRTHEGQVKAMSSFDGNEMSVVVSGGDDLVPKITPLREYGKENHRFLPTLPQMSPMRSARYARLLVSWWDKSISIWRLSRRAELDSEAEASHPPRRLVAKLSLDIKGRIRSVAISDDGRALVAATSFEVKAFQLRRRPDANALSVRKLEVPKELESSGARLIKFSPDGKWLAAASLDNEVQIVRFATVPLKPKQILVLNKVVELERREPQDDSLVGFKQYGRVISQLAFAPNSSVVACGDYSGNLDSWVLEGHEDLTAPPIDVSKHDSRNGASDDSSDSSDDDDDVCIIYGQHWTDNPVGQLLPKLESGPLVFTFRPLPATQSNADLVNGNPGIHSTRHNPHAHSHELPRGSSLLWIMTAQHKMYEIDVLGGRLSDWSRRNPSSALPEDFTNLTDRVKGAIWDINAARERIWLFGTTWGFMLNVGGDLVTKQSLKRHTAEEGTDRAKRVKLSGAGGKKQSDHRIAMPEKIKRYEGGEWEDHLLETPKAAADDDVDEDDDGDAENRLRLTRLNSGSQALATTQSGPQERSYYFTFKYRPILGVVPIDDDAAGADVDKVPEAVIVERPLWDVK